MADLAAQLHSPGIRVFGDRINAGGTRAATQGWIVESLNMLIEKVNHLGVTSVWKTHGDFSSRIARATDSV